MALVIAVLTAAALVWWGIVTTDAGIGRFWSEPEHGEAGPHGDVTDAEREELRKVLEQIDREKSAE